MSKKKEPTKYELRTRRNQQIFFALIGVIVILSMVISLVAK
jgi:predicted nucleic acid-binding Zn ribbon protein